VTTTNRVEGVSRDQGYGDKPAPDLPLGWTRWKMPIDIPTFETAKRLAVRVSLSTAHANSKADGQPSPDGAFIYLPEPHSIQIEI
jgi:hypothetical protein